VYSGNSRTGYFFGNKLNLFTLNAPQEAYVNSSTGQL
jgi:hypothetical protein